MANEGIKVIAQNKKARHDYFIEQTMETGIVCPEPKSSRSGRAR
jgi:SsrA-binding protein